MHINYFKEGKKLYKQRNDRELNEKSTKQIHGCNIKP